VRGASAPAGGARRPSPGTAPPPAPPLPPSLPLRRGGWRGKAQTTAGGRGAAPLLVGLRPVAPPRPAAPAAHAAAATAVPGVPAAPAVLGLVRRRRPPHPETLRRPGLQRVPSRGGDRVAAPPPAATNTLRRPLGRGGGLFRPVRRPDDGSRRHAAAAPAAALAAAAALPLPAPAREPRPTTRACGREQHLVGVHRAGASSLLPPPPPRLSHRTPQIRTRPRPHRRPRSQRATQRSGVLARRRSAAEPPPPARRGIVGRAPRRCRPLRSAPFRPPRLGAAATARWRVAHRRGHALRPPAGRGAPRGRPRSAPSPLSLSVRERNRHLPRPGGRVKKLKPAVLADQAQDGDCGAAQPLGTRGGCRGRLRTGTCPSRNRSGRYRRSAAGTRRHGCGRR